MNGFTNGWKLSPPCSLFYCFDSPPTVAEVCPFFLFTVKPSTSTKFSNDDYCSVSTIRRYHDRLKVNALPDSGENTHVGSKSEKKTSLQRYRNTQSISWVDLLREGCRLILWWKVCTIYLIRKRNCPFKLIQWVRTLLCATHQYYSIIKLHF